MRELRGKNAIVTGASRGIGVHIARALAREGMNLVLVARARAPLDALASELTASGVKAVAIAIDLEPRQNALTLALEAKRLLGPIDVLVNNAALEINAAFLHITPEEIAQLMQIDLVAPMLLTHALLPDMLARKSGHIVNIASLAGKSPTPYDVPYAAAKGGLVLFGQSLRGELHGSGVSTSLVCPGFVSEAGMFADKQRETGVVEPKIVGSVTPEHVARAVVRALRTDAAELLVAPGPMRFLLALGQLFPDFAGWVARRTGVTELFRRAAALRAPPETK